MSKFRKKLGRFSIFNAITTFAMIFIVVLLIANFTTAVVDGSSMFPTYKDGDLLLIRKTENVEFGDIVAIYSSRLDELLCKRVIGVAGDEVQIKGTSVYLNGELIEEDYVLADDWSYGNKPDVTFTGADIIDNNGFHIRVKDGYLFVMGDNRPCSTDSRELGCLKVSDLYGISIFNMTKSLHITYMEFRTILFFTVAVLTAITVFGTYDNK